MDQGYNLYNIEPKFKNFLRAENISVDTLKNYLSDIRHFTGWLANVTGSHENSKSLTQIINRALVEEYKEYLSKNNVPAVTVNRRLSSLRKFFDFLIEEKIIVSNSARDVPNIQRVTKINRIKHKLGFNKEGPRVGSDNSAMPSDRPFLSQLKLLHQIPIRTGILAIIVLFILYASSSIIINKFSAVSKKSTTTVTQPKRGRILAFKGKLFDNLGNPITSKTDVTFKIYSKETADSSIYTGSCKGVNGIIPDNDGLASVVIGKDCSMDPIPQSVFSDNPGLYLGVTIGSDKELKPRQQIANVSYTLDSEKLQGLDIGGGGNSIPFIDENGAINIEALEGSINSLLPDGNFSIISGNSLSLESGDQGDITLTSGLSGRLKFKTGGFSDSVSNLFIGSDGNIGIGTENASDFKLQIAGDVGPDIDETFNLGSESKQWAAIYSSKFLQNGVALCDEQGNNCPTNISSWTLSSPYLYTNERNIRVGIGTSNTASIISKLYVTKDVNDNATGKALAIFDQTENQDIISASASGQTRFVVKNNGNTGIGTINPSARLDVSGGQTKIEVSTQYSQRLCHSGVEGTSTQNVLLGDCSTGGADIAEYYGSTDTTIESGDIVITKNGEMVGKNSKAYAEKSTKEYDSRVIGIVSTNPYDSFGNNFDENEYIFPVALAGRIPVKVSRGSDVIKAGDLLTSSEEKGKAMKAKKAGQIIGKALEDWSPEQDKSHVLVFVNLSWGDPELTLSSSGQVISQHQSAPYVYNGIIKKEEDQISLFNNLMERASEEEKKLLLFLWQAKDQTAEKTGGILDIAYSMAQNSLENTTLKIQNVFVSGKIISPIIETTDLAASGSSRLAEIHTNSIETDGKNIEIDLGEQLDEAEYTVKGPLAELIIRGSDGRKAASIDAEGNATFSGSLTAHSASISGQLNADTIASRSLESDQINSNTVSSNNLSSRDATISGTLIADDIESETIRALEQRINSLADSSRQKSELPASESADLADAASSALIASTSGAESTDSQADESSINTNEIQKLIAQLKNDSISDPQYYHVPDTIQNSSTNASNSPTISLKDQMEKLSLEDLTVTGNAHFYKLNAADSIAVGTMIIENNTILSLADNLNITALSTISLFDGAITIARDGTMTTKGAIIARSGIKTNTIEAIDKNVVIKLSPGVSGETPDENDNASEISSKLIIANAAGSEVASIDASGSAQFDGISVSKYMDATASGSLITAQDNLEKNGVFAPAYDAEKKAAGIGVVPQDSSEVVIYTDKIKEASLVYLTPTERLSEGQLSILEKESCLDTEDACRPYFRVGISIAQHPQLPFNWLIIN